MLKYDVKYNILLLRYHVQLYNNNNNNMYRRCNNILCCSVSIGYMNTIFLLYYIIVAYYKTVRACPETTFVHSANIRKWIWFYVRRRHRRTIAIRNNNWGYLCNTVSRNVCDIHAPPLGTFISYLIQKILWI